MFAKQRQGFTLVEMMVVIAIIGVLAGLLLVALGPAREAMRNFQCANNLKQLAHGVAAYHEAKDRFPGSFEYAPTNRNYIWPWTVNLMPYIEEKSRYDQFYNVPDFTNASNQNYVKLLAIYYCPSDPNAISGPHLNYVANMGRQDPTGMNDAKGNGVFHARAGLNAGVTPITLRLDEVKDGKGQTLLLTENQDARQWTYAVPATREFGVGVVWDPTTTQAGFNQDMNTVLSSNPPDLMHARPSSMHITSFNVALCDGAVRTVSQNISYPLYRLLMTPDGRKAVPQTIGVVNESDLQE